MNFEGEAVVNHLAQQVAALEQALQDSDAAPDSPRDGSSIPPAAPHDDSNGCSSGGLTPSQLPPRMPRPSRPRPSRSAPPEAHSATAPAASSPTPAPPHSPHSSPPCKMTRNSLERRSNGSSADPARHPSGLKRHPSARANEISPAVEASLLAEAEATRAAVAAVAEESRRKSEALTSHRLDPSGSPEQGPAAPAGAPQAHSAAELASVLTLSLRQGAFMLAGQQIAAFFEAAWLQRQQNHQQQQQQPPATPPTQQSPATHLPSSQAASPAQTDVSPTHAAHVKPPPTPPTACPSSDPTGRDQQAMQRQEDQQQQQQQAHPPPVTLQRRSGTSSDGGRRLDGDACPTADTAPAGARSSPRLAARTESNRK